MGSEKVTRMSAEDRRELVIAAATRAFARSGYAGTSTDVIAKEAGVSQPYVVRIFGTKLELFLEVFERSSSRIRTAFEAVLDERPFDRDSEEDWMRLGLAYGNLVADRDFLHVLMHGFIAGSVPEIGRLGRRGMADIFAVVKRTGCTDEEARDFIAKGMLINVMLAMQAPENVDGGPLDDLTTCALGASMDLLQSPA
jgi:AcrR family transcriptional regulator